MIVKRLICGTSLLLLLVCGVYVYFISRGFLWFQQDHAVVTMVSKDHLFAPVRKTLRIEIVNTPESIVQGLSGRSDLVWDNESVDGLLFVFPDKEIRHFWMNQMHFSIDMCWLLDLRILACARDVPPPVGNADPARARSVVPVNFVLETRPGFFTEEELGSKLFFQWEM